MAFMAFGAGAARFLAIFIAFTDFMAAGMVKIGKRKALQRFWVKLEPKMFTVCKRSCAMLTHAQTQRKKYCGHRGRVCTCTCTCILKCMQAYSNDLQNRQGQLLQLVGFYNCEYRFWSSTYDLQNRLTSSSPWQSKAPCWYLCSSFCLGWPYRAPNIAFGFLFVIWDPTETRNRFMEQGRYMWYK